MSHTWKLTPGYDYNNKRWECSKCGAVVWFGFNKPRKTLRVMNPFGGPAVTCEQYAVLSVQES